MLRIQSAVSLGEHWLRLTLTDGSVVDREVGALLQGPVLEPIRTDPVAFASVTVVEGSVAWWGGADLDPDVLIWGDAGVPADGAPQPSMRLRGIHA